MIEGRALMDAHEWLPRAERKPFGASKSGTAEDQPLSLTQERSGNTPTLQETEAFCVGKATCKEIPRAAKAAKWFPEHCPADTPHLHRERAIPGRRPVGREGKRV